MQILQLDLKASVMQKTDLYHHSMSFLRSSLKVRVRLKVRETQFLRFACRAFPEALAAVRHDARVSNGPG